jgi:hypothetical protein
MTEENGNRRDRLTLSPPTFSLPDNIGDYELWTVRLPTSLDIAALQGVKLDTEKLGTFQSDNVEYGMTYGHAVENEHFRLLVRSDGDYLHLHNRPFDRHVNIVDASSLVETADTELAPRLEMAPPAVDQVRTSYSHIPQASGLKRRWMPPGVSASATTCTVMSKGTLEHDVVPVTPSLVGTNGSVPSSTDVPPSKQQANHEETPMMNGGDTKKLSKKEKKAMKKAEKKAKKERKREKKRKRES